MVYVIIPASLESRRLPNKLLLKETGQTLLQHTWENCQKIDCAGVFVATASESIRREAEGFGATVLWSSIPHRDGTGRVMESAASLPRAEVIVNVQAEWPSVDVGAIDRIVRAASRADGPVVWSLYYNGAAGGPNLVKVVTSLDNRALYFSRLPIPFGASTHKIHVGVYVFNRAVVDGYALLPSVVNGVEDLEQLVFIENNIPFYVEETAKTAGVDTPADYEAFRVSHSG